MKRLLILRHAKSSWSEAGLGDHERPLNKRGRKAAPLMGAWMAHQGYRPDGILCSSSVRTRETLDLVRPYLGRKIPVMIERRVYLADAHRLLTLLRNLPADWDSALLIGHNPGLAELVELLRDPGASRCAAAGKSPTAALAVFDLPVTDWTRVDSGMGALIELTRPRDLHD